MFIMFGWYFVSFTIKFEKIRLLISIFHWKNTILENLICFTSIIFDKNNIGGSKFTLASAFI